MRVVKSPNTKVTKHAGMNATVKKFIAYFSFYNNYYKSNNLAITHRYLIKRIYLFLNKWSAEFITMDYVVGKILTTKTLCDQRIEIVLILFGERVYACKTNVTHLSSTNTDTRSLYNRISCIAIIVFFFHHTSTHLNISHEVRMFIRRLSLRKR